MKLRTAILATVVLGTIFVVGPIGMIRLNEALGWPRWDGPRLTGTGIWWTMARPQSTRPGGAWAEDRVSAFGAWAGSLQAMASVYPGYKATPASVR